MGAINRRRFIINHPKICFLSWYISICFKMEGHLQALRACSHLTQNAKCIELNIQLLSIISTWHTLCSCIRRVISRVLISLPLKKNAERTRKKYDASKKFF